MLWVLWAWCVHCWCIFILCMNVLIDKMQLNIQVSKLDTGSYHACTITHVLLVYIRSPYSISRWSRTQLSLTLRDFKLITKRITRNTIEMKCFFYTANFTWSKKIYENTIHQTLNVLNINTNISLQNEWLKKEHHKHYPIISHWHLLIRKLIYWYIK